MSIHVRKHTPHYHHPAGKVLCHLNSGEMTLTISENHTARHATEVGLLQILFQEPIKEQIAVEIPYYLSFEPREQVMLLMGGPFFSPFTFTMAVQVLNRQKNSKVLVVKSRKTS